MTVQIQQPWEYRLLTWAEEALRTPQISPRIETDQHTLEAAYLHCAAITRENSKTFFMAANLLPPEKRRATYALYAFCRITDDIVDNQAQTLDRQLHLESWRQRATSTKPTSNDLVALAWMDARSRYNIPTGYAHQLIDGVAQDLFRSRYETFAQLAEYSYGVASTVGLMAMHITGFAGEQALPYAVRLGVALQLTNILRDIGEDWRIGRLYLPLDELNAFGLDEEFIARGEVNDRWRNFMRFQIQRTRRLYDESWEGIAMLNSDGRFAIAAAADLYRAILKDIEAHDYDVFSRRAHIGLTGKMVRLPRIWWRSQQNIDA